MRILFASLLLAWGGTAMAGPKQKLELPEADKKPTLRIAPGYDYIAGDPAVLEVNARMGGWVWLSYYNGEPAAYAGEPGAAAAGRREVMVESSATPGFEAPIAAAPATPDPKGHIRLPIAPQPLGFTTAIGQTRSYYLRVHTPGGFSNPVKVNISGLLLKPKS